MVAFHEFFLMITLIRSRKAIVANISFHFRVEVIFVISLHHVTEILLISRDFTNNIINDVWNRAARESSLRLSFSLKGKLLYQNCDRLKLKKSAEEIFSYQSFAGYIFSREVFSPLRFCSLTLSLQGSRLIDCYFLPS